MLQNSSVLKYYLLEKKRRKKIIQRGFKQDFIINIPFMSLIILIFSKALSVL